VRLLPARCDIGAAPVSTDRADERANAACCGISQRIADGGWPRSTGSGQERSTVVQSARYYLLYIMFIIGV